MIVHGGSRIMEEQRKNDLSGFRMQTIIHHYSFFQNNLWE